jgi:two-component system KDP operon response regulator KdpE
MTDPRPTVLVIEDEPEIRRFLRSSLDAEGYRVVEASSGRRGAIDATTHKPDLAIVDLGLPDFDGVEVVRRIRDWSRMPIIVLSARIDERSKIEALDAGANDNVLNFENATVDLIKRRATRDGAEIRLTPLEFRLLACLARQLGMVITHRQLLTEVWGPTHQDDTHYLRIYMKQLRDKLEVDPVRPRHLLTETGVGYRLVLGE